MGLEYILGATPVMESTSSRLKLVNLMKGVPVKVPHLKLEPLTLLRLFLTVSVLILSQGQFILPLKQNWTENSCSHI